MQITTTPERVAHVMKALDLSQVEIAKMSGASKSMVNQWLSGLIKAVGPRYAFNLERTTGFRAEWLMLGTGPVRTAHPPEPNIITDRDHTTAVRDLTHAASLVSDSAIAKYATPPPAKSHTEWPFSRSLLVRVMNLNEYHRGIIEGRLRAVLDEVEAEQKTASTRSANGKP